MKAYPHVFGNTDLGGIVPADFAPRRIADLEHGTSSEIRNLEAQIDLLREARRGAPTTQERDEIEARRVVLRRQLIAARRALAPKPVSPSFFRRFVAALLSR